MNSRFIQDGRRAKAQAFTLVEITLAIGIVAFSMLVTIGMTSTASQSFGDTRRTTVYANIVQYINANANLTPFAELDDASNANELNGKTWKFDQEGLRTDDNASFTGTSVYTAQITVTVPPILPPTTGGAVASTATKAVNVKITDSGTTTANAANFHFLIGDLGK